MYAITQSQLIIITFVYINLYPW